MDKLATFVSYVALTSGLIGIGTSFYFLATQGSNFWVVIAYIISLVFLVMSWTHLSWQLPRKSVGRVISLSFAIFGALMGLVGAIIFWTAANLEHLQATFCYGIGEVGCYR